MVKTSRFQTRMIWNGDHWDVALSGMVDGRVRLLATIRLDEWISLGATQYVLELVAESAGLLKPTVRLGPR